MVKLTIHKVANRSAVRHEPLAHTQKHGKVAPKVGCGAFPFLVREFRVEVGNNDLWRALHSHGTVPRRFGIEKAGKRLYWSTASPAQLFPAFSVKPPSVMMTGNVHQLLAPIRD